MKNNTEIIDRIKLMMSYNSEKTLNENLNILNEGKSTEVDESRGAISKELKALGLGTKETAVISAMGKEFGLADNLIATALTKDLTQLTKELETAVKADLKNGVRQNLGPLAKQASKLKAMKEMANKSQELKKVGKELTTKEITNIIERTKGEAKSMSQKLEGKYTARIAKRDAKKAANNADAAKGAGSGNVTVNVNQNVGGASGNLTKAAEDAVAAGDDKIKGILDDAKKLPNEKPSRWARWKAWGERNPKSKKLLYLLGFGGAGYAAYKMLFSDTTPEQAKQLTFSNCAGSLVDDEGTIIKTTTGGDPVLKVTKTGNPEYDSKGGLLLYNNGRVFMGHVKVVKLL
jgi:predicted HicB family RNase H-like nuclease